MGGTCAAMLNREIFLTELLSSSASPSELASEVAMELASPANGQKRDPYPPFLSPARGSADEPMLDLASPQL